MGILRIPPPAALPTHIADEIVRFRSQHAEVLYNEPLCGSCVGFSELFHKACPDVEMLTIYSCPNHGLGNGHCMNIIGDICIDWTFAQFGQESDFELDLEFEHIDHLFPVVQHRKWFSQFFTTGLRTRDLEVADKLIGGGHFGRSWSEPRTSGFKLPTIAHRGPDARRKFSGRYSVVALRR